MSSYDFTGKTAIVTGGTSGIGKCVTKALYQSGANVVISGRSRSKGNRLVEELGERAHFLPGNIQSEETNVALVKAADKRFGSLDCLVLAAGQLGVGKLDELSLEGWRATLATNLDAVFYILKHAIPKIRENGGSVVVIGSMAAFHAFPSHPAYTASKGALLPLLRQLARDYSPDIRFNLVSPAQVETPLLYDSVRAFENPDTILRETALALPMQRLGQPADIASMVMYLLSEDASWVTGSNFNIDGGFLAT